jgi:hypothetical protein
LRKPKVVMFEPQMRQLLSRCCTSSGTATEHKPADRARLKPSGSLARARSCRRRHRLSAVRLDHEGASDSLRYRRRRCALSEIGSGDGRCEGVKVAQQLEAPGEVKLLDPCSALVSQLASAILITTIARECCPYLTAHTEGLLSQRLPPQWDHELAKVLPIWDPKRLLLGAAWEPSPSRYDSGVFRLFS